MALTYLQFMCDGRREGGVKPSFEARLQALEARHKATDEILRHEQARPQPRPDWLRSLKRDKLRLKDQIENLRARAVPAE